MNSFLRTLVMTGVPFGVFMGLFFSFRYGGRIGTSSGIVSGILFGLIMAIFAKVQENKARSSPPALIDERLIREGSASHSNGRKGAIGRMYLTDKRLLFEAFPANKGANEVSIPIHQVSDASREKSFGILPNQLHIVLGDDRIEKFLTDDVNESVTEILGARQSYHEEARSEQTRLFP